MDGQAGRLDELGLLRLEGEPLDVVAALGEQAVDHRPGRLEAGRRQVCRDARGQALGRGERLDVGLGEEGGRGRG